MVAVQVFYSGRVQGVGFRYTTTEIARRFRVVGWVRNLSDGRVELWVEGDSAEVSEFLSGISEQFRGKIHSEDRAPVTATETHSDFRIR